MNFFLSKIELTINLLLYPSPSIPEEYIVVVTFPIETSFPTERLWATSAVTVATPPFHSILEINLGFLSSFLFNKVFSEILKYF